MYRLLATTLWILCALGARAQATDAPETPFASAITEVRVYQNRAGITQQGKLTLATGEHTLIFSGLSPQIQPQSIQVSGTGAGVIQSVSHRVSYLNRTPKTRRMVQIEDSLSVVLATQEELADREFVLGKELELILKNNDLKSDAGLTTDELTKLSQFYATRLAQLKAEQLAVKRRQKALSEAQGRLRSELEQITAGRNQPTQEVVVVYKANQPGTVNLKLDYLVGGAYWAPAYDLRATSSGKEPIRLSLKALVSNQTGVDWNGVKLTLSTANPTTGGTPPNIPTQYLDQYSYSDAAGYGANRSLSAPAPAAAGAGGDAYAEDEVAEEAKVAETATDYTEVVESALSIEYAIALPYSVPADGKPKTVDIQQYSLPVRLAYYSAPKYDDDAFLQARIGGWEQYNLLPGRANVYFDGAFLTETSLNPTITQDTLAIGLGRDPQIVIKREQLRDYTSRKTIGTNVRETRGYKIEVRNTKKEPIELLVEDQFPVSQNKAIEVVLAEGHGAAVNPQNGRLTWKLTLKPNETRTLSFQYEVKYPKDWQVTGL